jgi:putative membrane protein
MFGPGMMGGFLGGWGIIGTIIGFIFILAIIIGVILLIVWLVKRTSYSGEIPSKTSDALEILKQRYAKGEVSKEEFEKIKKEIT